VRRIVIIGAGIGGLTSAALLARCGFDVTVLEAQVYAGGCAGTYFHQGYRFDAGATLSAGFYPGGPMEEVAQAAGIDSWPVGTLDLNSPVMLVHLPDGCQVSRWGDERRMDEYVQNFGEAGGQFFAWQERTAEVMWQLAMLLPAWPAQSTADLGGLTLSGLHWLANDGHPGRLPGLIADAFRPVAAHLNGAPERLRWFVDGQLLISAQAVSRHANALYGAAALDLPRRGVYHLIGGMGALAERLVRAVRENGGKVLFRKEATRIVLEKGLPVAVETKQGESFPADQVIANIPPWNIARLLGDDAPARLRRLPGHPQPGWGAFMVYAGIDENVLPPDSPLHHQVIQYGQPGEGRTVFLSISPHWDASRAPNGRRALTISTHTALETWWRLFEQDRDAYEARKNEMMERILQAAEKAIPHLRDAVDLVLPATPVTFERFTRRDWGWVGGFPQTDLFRAWGPRLGAGLWMVGDSIFPGQSTAAVALGGLRLGRLLTQY
jgi:C-3',4' desaturase CrtD